MMRSEFLRDNRDNKRVLSKSLSRGYYLWNTESGEVVQQVKGTWSGGRGGYVLTPDESKVASIVKDRRVKLWELETGDMVWQSTPLIPEKSSSKWGVIEIDPHREVILVHPTNAYSVW
jgi:WD40 repeat protein